MPVSDENVRIMVTVTREVAEEIDRYAERFRRSRSGMAASILEGGLESLRFYDRYVLKPESAWNASAVVDRVLGGLGLPQVFGTEGKRLNDLPEGRD